MVPDVAVSANTSKIASIAVVTHVSVNSPPIFSWNVARTILESLAKYREIFIEKY